MSLDPAAITLRQTAQAMLARQGLRDRLCIFFEFMRGAQEADWEALSLIEDEPPRIGDERFDCLLAAAGDFVAAQLGEPCPQWATAGTRFLQTPWWVSNLASGRLLAIAHCPRAFRVRGIHIDIRDLTSDGRKWPLY
ncbi:hypothetical protein HNP40_001413 [Mycobacteroides chelonae]|nr:hypothetical protein [Mycobacteroides chelonae]